MQRQRGRPGELFQRRQVLRVGRAIKEINQPAALKQKLRRGRAGVRVQAVDLREEHLLHAGQPRRRKLPRGNDPWQQRAGFIRKGIQRHLQIIRAAPPVIRLVGDDQHLLLFQHRQSQAKIIVRRQRIRRQVHFAQMDSRAAHGHRHRHFFLRPRRQGHFLVHAHLFIQRHRDAAGERLLAEIAERNLERHRIARQHLRLRRPGVQDGAVVAPGGSHIHKEKPGGWRQHLEIGVGPFFAREVREIINLRPRRGRADDPRGRRVGQVDVCAAEPRLDLAQKPLGAGDVARERHETGGQFRVGQQNVHRVVRAQGIHQLNRFVDGPFA